MRWFRAPRYRTVRLPLFPLSASHRRYAKYFRSYAIIEGGLVHLALVDLTGGSSELIKMDTGKGKEDAKSGALWATMLKYHEQGHLMGAGSNAGKDTVCEQAQCTRLGSLCVCDVGPL